MKKKRYNLKVATNLLTPYLTKKFVRGGPHQVCDALFHLPNEIEDSLVIPALLYEAKASGVIHCNALSALISEWSTEEDSATRGRWWARPVVQVLRTLKRDPWTRYFLAALPEQEDRWAEHLDRLESAHQGWDCITFAKQLRQEDRTARLRQIASDPDVVCGLRAVLPSLEPSTEEESFLVLAAEGSEASMALLEPFVASLLEDPTSMDWLHTHLLPLLTSPASAPLRDRIKARRERRNQSGPQQALAQTLGLEEDLPLQFKIGLYAEGGMPRIRLWVDTSKHPWYDARWNWDELVHWPQAKDGANALEELQHFLEFCLADGKGTFQTWEWVSPLRGKAKQKLVEWLSEIFSTLEGPRPASAPLKNWKG